ncbi:hypothetical protein BZG84_14715 [Salinivibrio sp. PR932]|uniref:5-oxoprolinase subunit C family protein n=1 Tax=Salinivibrio sp. PR932 TaxID=1909492 RepID=UPI000989477C|nr:biotin-dependent carboxyltransferase family protein [Salinivibrio sp. PR932]OOF14093.1 hypothetical protein BZG84_14715 [Salinivibrio sp. PR932]
MVAGLTVLDPGVLSLVQDTGRYGVGQLGLSQGGPVDCHAFAWANYLLDNPANTPLVEITMGQARFRADHAMSIAITGADMQPCINGQRVGMWQTLTLNAGDELRLRYARRGLRAYLAVCGGWAVDGAFGSAATVMRNQLGGLHSGLGEQAGGMALTKGDVLPCRPHALLPRVRGVPTRFIPDYNALTPLALVPGYQFDSFSAEALTAFFDGEYTVNQHSDRMGVRLNGPSVVSKQPGIVSEGIALGAVQVPPDGQPIVLLNDRQTLGGYPKLGCLTRASLSMLAQTPPGQAVRFYPARLADASAQWQEFVQFFDWI